MSWLEIENLSVRYNDDLHALDDVGFSMSQGEFFTVVGPTNAGKSTLLKTIAGLEKPYRGQIHLAGRDITASEPRARNLSLLFQNIALFPTLTGRQNIGFPLRGMTSSEEEKNIHIEAIASTLNVTHLLDRLPQTFSGGEQQRVAIGRSLAAKSNLLMLDEPLTNLDARIRIALRLEFKKIHRETGQSILYVTHDQIEAMSLSDRIAVLNKGRFEQVGTPDDLYNTPATAFVARFMGSPAMNLLPASIEINDGELLATGDGFATAVKGDANFTRPERTAVGVRPEHICVSPVKTTETPHTAEVLWIERLGDHHILDVRLGMQTVKVRTHPDHPVNGEGPVWLGFDIALQQILDLETDRFPAIMAI
jgi:multiple sugar transport system ATP-binding protein